jgi:hypothetical protein
MMRALRRLAPGLWGIGLALLFASQRWATDGPLHWILLILALLLLLDALIARGTEWAGAAAARAAIAPSLMGYLVASAGLVVYLLSTSWFVDTVGFGEDLAQSWRGITTVAWLLLVVGGSAVALAADWSRAGLTRLELADRRRVMAASGGALSLVLAVGWVASFNFVMDESDTFWEWAEGARVKPSDATLDLVDNLKEEVEIVAFFPTGNEVRERIRPFFDSLQGRNSQLTINFLDHAVEPARARELGARRNGVLFVVRGDEKERVDLDVDYKKAKRKLKKLDGDLQEALLKIGREKQTLYLTIGHGERSARQEDDDPRLPIKDLKEVFTKLNVSTKDLGLQDGLAGDIPDDAGVIMVIGPDAPFLPEELQTLRDWWADGGALMLFLEPGSDHGLGPLLEDMGVELPEGVVCNDNYHMVKERGPSDNAIVFSARFGSHPAVSVNAKYPQQLAVVLYEAGAVHKAAAATGRSQVLIRPMANTFLDTDGNYVQGPAEALENDSLSMAVSKDSEAELESRAVVVGDADLVADGILGRPGNVQFLVDSYRWLAREDAAELRVTSPDEDPPLEHTRAQDARWFTVTVFGVPLLALGLGTAWVRRRRRGGAR